MKIIKKVNLLIPKYNKNEVIDIQDIIRLKTLYTNLKSEYEKIIGKIIILKLQLQMKEKIILEDLLIK